MNERTQKSILQMARGAIQERADYGYAWSVCHGYEEAISTLQWYLAMPASGLRETL